MAYDKPFDPTQKFLEFMRGYVDDNGKYPYHEKVARVVLEGQRSLVIDFDDILGFDTQLARTLLAHPEVLIDAASSALKMAVEIEDRDVAEKAEKAFHARFVNLPEEVTLRDIRAEHLGRFLSLEGILVRTSVVKPLLDEGYFQCKDCGEIQLIKTENGKYRPPTQCISPACNNTKKFFLMEEESTYIDWQKVTVQERPESLPAGQMPRSLNCFVLDDLVAQARAGDRVTVSGILKMTPTKTVTEGKIATYDMYVDVNYIAGTDQGFEADQITPEEEEIIWELAKDPNVHKKLIKSIAPSIWGMNDIKEGICLLLFGGVDKMLPDGVRLRGQSNVLLVGDPGTAKSQMLTYVHRVAPRSLFASGKSSSAAGLTAAVVRDADSGEFTLEAGALVLADRGIACVTGDCQILFNNQMISIADIFDTEKAYAARSYGKQIEEVEICETTGEVLSIDSTLRVKRATAVRVRRKKHQGKILRIQLASGASIGVTPDHLLPHGGSFEWREAEDFREGDYLIAPRPELLATRTFGFGAEHQGTDCAERQFPVSYTVCGQAATVATLNDAESSLFLAEIVRITAEEVDDYVYDLHVPSYHNFIADGFVSHNCIDEFDKMTTHDRSSIHEAMEQQSFHPSTKLMWADGSEVPIGEFVDKLMAERQADVVAGVNCEILPVKEGEFEVISTDFRSFFKAPVDRVSRHPAADTLVQINFSNGRRIVITEEHPVFVIFKEGVKAIRADEAKVGEVVPIPLSVRPDCDNDDATEDESGHVVDCDGVDKKLQNNVPNDGATESQQYTLTDKIEFLKLGFDGHGLISPTGAPEYKNVPEAPARNILNWLLELGITTSMNWVDEKHFVMDIRIDDHCVPQFVRCVLMRVESENGWKSHYVSAADKAQRIAKIRQGYDEVGAAIRPVPRHFVMRLLEIGRTLDLEFDNASTTPGSTEKEQKPLVPFGLYSELKQKVDERLMALYLATHQFDSFVELSRTFELSNESISELIGSLLAAKAIQLFDEGAYKDMNEMEIMLYEKSARASLRRGLVRLEHELTALDGIVGSPQIGFAEITSVEMLSNAGDIACKFVYDVTVEPNHSFVSEALILHNTVSVAKAGIVATLNARTSVLAAANPKFGRYEAHRSTAENINLPSTILSRFDLIFILKDIPNDRIDERKAEHILGLHRAVETGMTTPPVEEDMLRKFISYAKQRVNPVLTENASNRIKEYYLEMRRKSDEIEGSIAITARQLEALVRLAEARSRMALRKQVLIDDAEAAIRVMEASLQEVGIDPVTGLRDIDAVMSNTTSSSRGKRDNLVAILEEMASKRGKSISTVDAIKRADAEGINKVLFDRLLQRLKDEGLVFEPTPGYIRYLGHLSDTGQR